MEFKYRYIGNRQHQGLLFKAALGPDIPLGKRESPIPFRISCSVCKIILPSVEGKVPLKAVGHAEHPVFTLHERNKGKGTHNIVTKRCCGTEAKLAGQIQVLFLNIQKDPLFSENTIAYFYRQRFFTVL